MPDFLALVIVLAFLNMTLLFKIRYTTNMIPIYIISVLVVLWIILMFGIARHLKLHEDLLYVRNLFKQGKK